MIHVFTITVETERQQGKFMSRDEVNDALVEALIDADPGSVEGGADGDSVYDVVSWEVESVEQQRKTRKKATP